MNRSCLLLSIKYSSQILCVNSRYQNGFAKINDFPKLFHCLTGKYAITEILSPQALFGINPVTLDFVFFCVNQPDQ